MSLGGSEWAAPPVRTEQGSRFASDAAPITDVSGLDVVFGLLDGEPLESLLRDDDEDWGDAALYSALFPGAALADEPLVGNSPPPAQRAEVPGQDVAHPCLDTAHSLPWLRVCAKCSPAPAEGEEGAGAAPSY